MKRGPEATRKFLVKTANSPRKTEAARRSELDSMTVAAVDGPAMFRGVVGRQGDYAVGKPLSAAVEKLRSDEAERVQRLLAPSDSPWAATRVRFSGARQPGSVFGLFAGGEVVAVTPN